LAARQYASSISISVPVSPVPVSVMTVIGWGLLSVIGGCSQPGPCYRLLTQYVLGVNIMARTVTSVDDA
jgi:hypothetical protein